MSTEKPFAALDTLPQGAVFHRCALQVNPHDYAATFRGSKSDGAPEEYVRAIIEKAAKEDISVLAITDHNDVSSVHLFRKEAEGKKTAKGREMTIFPGFELASSEGVHVLCIYSPDAGQGNLERFLGEFGIRKTESSADLSSKRFGEILVMVHDQKGIAVAAHATNDGGLFEVLDGKARINAWRNKQLLAVQIPGPIDALPHKYRQIVQNKDPNYRRGHPADEELAVAVVNAKDVAKPEDLADISSSCMIKMSEVGIEGLRQAFMDPLSRIRLNSQLGDVPKHPELVALSWQGGFLDGVTIPLNSNLNVLVGGRGAGKSTVIESVRYALELSPVGKDAQLAHDNIVHDVLRNGTKVSLLVRSHYPQKKGYRIERTVPNSAVVRDWDGNDLRLFPCEIIPGVEIYGQHEIAEIARDSEKNVTKLLRRFADTDKGLPQRKAEILRGLEKSRKSILEINGELQQIEERLAKLPGLENMLQRYREAGVDERLRERSLLVREEQLLDSIPERLAPFDACLETLRTELPIDRTFLSPKALKGLPGKAVLEETKEVLTQLSRDLETLRPKFEEALQRAKQRRESIRTRWNEHRDNIQDSYERVLRELQQSDIDGAEFIGLRRELENLRPLRQRQVVLQQSKKAHEERRCALLTEWQELKQTKFQQLRKAAKKIEKQLPNRLQAGVTAERQRDRLYELLRESKGRFAEAIGALEKCDAFTVSQFVARCRGGAGELQTAYPGIPPAQLESLAKMPEELLMRMEELDLPATTSIRLNVENSEQPVWKDLKHLSAGQKSTAVLLILLLDSKAPLVVDQPEDDLDNRFITDGVIPKIREGKQYRQLLFSTHNANIPVLGDADLILGLTVSSDSDKVKAHVDPNHMGAIDKPSVREMVEEILEGGKVAFETRRRKYGF